MRAQTFYKILFPTHRAITLWTVLEKMGLKVLTSGGKLPLVKAALKKKPSWFPGITRRVSCTVPGQHEETMVQFDHLVVLHPVAVTFCP